LINNLNNVVSKYKELNKKMISCKNKLVLMYNKPSKHKLLIKENLSKYLIIIYSLEINQITKSYYDGYVKKIQRSIIKK
jgi:hypothetical protein